MPNAVRAKAGQARVAETRAGIRAVAGRVAAMTAAATTVAAKAEETQVAVEAVKETFEARSQARYSS